VVVVVVLVLPPPCCACAAAGTAASALTRNAVDKMRTNTDASLFRLDVEKYGPAISLPAQAPFRMREPRLQYSHRLDPLRPPDARVHRD